MSHLRILLTAGLALTMLATEASAQRRSGGAVSSGVRGAAVGGLMGGSSGAEKGAKVGVAVGVARGVATRAEERSTQQTVTTEAQARTQYEASPEYQNAQHSDFSNSPPQLIGTSKTPGVPVKTKEAVIQKDGKPVIGITYPADWKQTAKEHSVMAVSKDKHAWSEIGTLERISDREAGIKMLKTGLAKYLQDIKYDEPTETKRGALVLTGTGKGMKAGNDVVFALGVFTAGEEQLGAVAFAVDKNVEDHYKETVKFVCENIRIEKDLAKPAAKK